MCLDVGLEFRGAERHLHFSVGALSDGIGDQNLNTRYILCSLPNLADSALENWLPTTRQDNDMPQLGENIWLHLRSLRDQL